jgi:hypothetical protein
MESSMRKAWSNNSSSGPEMALFTVFIDRLCEVMWELTASPATALASWPQSCTSYQEQIH